jgi:rhamnose transport system permease protein
LTGVCTGALLVSVIGIDYLRRHGAWAEGSGRIISEEEFSMKNSQVAMLCATIVAAALIVAGTNVWLVRSLNGPGNAAAANTAAANTASGGATRRPIIAMMPKAKGDPYFVSVRGGAEEAARELGVELIWDGPTSLEAAKQNEIVESWITRHVDVIAVSVSNKAGISTVLRKARKRITFSLGMRPNRLRAISS